jgi:hypothetical protein
MRGRRNRVPGKARKKKSGKERMGVSYSHLGDLDLGLEGEEGVGELLPLTKRGLDDLCDSMSTWPALDMPPPSSTTLGSKCPSAHLPRARVAQKVAGSRVRPLIPHVRRVRVTVGRRLVRRWDGGPARLLRVDEDHVLGTICGDGGVGRGAHFVKSRIFLSFGAECKSDATNVMHSARFSRGYIHP